MWKPALFILSVICICICADDTPIWTQCTPTFCAYIYQVDICGVRIKVTTHPPLSLTLVEKTIDLSTTRTACQTFGGCNYCINFEDFNSTEGPCIYLAASGLGCKNEISKLGCVGNNNNLAACDSQGCPNACSSKGTCMDDGTCKCVAGYYGDDCSQRAPTFEQCVSGANNEKICLNLKTDDCDIRATVTYQGFPVYDKRILASEMNNTFQGEDNCFTVGTCSGCLLWDDYVLNETYAHACPRVNLSCTGLPLPVPPVDQRFDCFTDTALVPACFGACPLDCSSIGTCLNGVCQCPVGFRGMGCELPSCEDLFDCFGHGSCVAPNQCKCNDGYIGDNCGSALCLSVNSCSGHGLCVRPNYCKCDSNHTGNDCSSVYCNQPCENGGSCLGGVCQCTGDWQPPYCQSKQATGGGSDGSKSKTGFIVAGVVVVVVAGFVAAGVYYVWRQKSKRAQGRYDGLVQDSDEQ